MKRFIFALAPLVAFVILFGIGCGTKSPTDPGDGPAPAPVPAAKTAITGISDLNGVCGTRQKFRSNLVFEISFQNDGAMDEVGARFLEADEVPACGGARSTAIAQMGTHTATVSAQTREIEECQGAPPYKTSYVKPLAYLDGKAVEVETVEPIHCEVTWIR